MATKNKKLLEFAPIFSVVMIVALWWAVACKINAEIILPKPKVVLEYMWQIFCKKSFYKTIIGSLSRVLASFFVALFCAIVLACVASISKFFEKFFYPIVVLVRATPTMSVIFLCIIWFKSWLSPMIVALAVIFPLLYVSTLEGIKSCDDKLKEMSALYKVPKSQQIFKFYLPCVARRVYSDAVSILALNVKLIIAAEALAQTNLSIGGEMKVAKEALETAELFAWTVCAVVLSYFMELVLKLIKKVVKGVVKNVRN